MKVSQALLLLPLAIAMPTLHSLGNIDITINIGETGSSITDDDSYYSCLVKTYPPDYENCPEGYVSKIPP